jgi:uncharacterized protein YxjI
VNYPLDLSFKLIALAPQISVTDAAGRPVCFVRQKMFKLKEAVTVFSDAQQTQTLATIQADRVLDISAQYHFAAADGRKLGSVKRQGLKSIWKCHYDIFDAEKAAMTIREDNAWIKVADAALMSIPFVGMFAGYVFHPTYTVTRAGGAPVLRLRKMPAFFEGKFRIERLADLTPDEEMRRPRLAATSSPRGAR